MKELYLISILFVSVFFGQAQSLTANKAKDSINSFILTLATYNHAERILAGTSKYIVTENYIKVSNIPLFEKSERMVYTKKISKSSKLVRELLLANMDTLKEFYFNYCIMMTSGNEYFLDFKNASTERSISLHHYYLKQLEDVILLINEYLPRRYRIHYLSKDTEQNCAL